MTRTAAIVGVGHVGGSLGMALRRAGYSVVGVDVHEPTITRAIERGAIDRGGSALSLLEGAGVVLVATPLDRVVDVARECAAHLSRDGLLVDVGSVKAPVVASLEASLPPGTLYVGGHPMFGNEGQGIDAADEALVENAPFVITPTARTHKAAIDHLTALAGELRMRPVFMTPEEHDTRIARLSHLPHLLAFALSRLEGNAETAGPSFLDATRVAMSPAAMWRAIFSMNRGPLREALHRLVAELEHLADLDGPSLERALDEGRSARQALAHRRSDRTRK